MALRVLRAVEEFCQREKTPAVTLRVPPEIAIYILNHKRAQLTAIEDSYGIYVYIESKPSLTASTYEIERGTNVPFEPRKSAQTAVTVESALEANDDDVVEEVAQEEAASVAESNVEEVADGDQSGAQPPREGDRRGGRRRRRRGGRDRFREDRPPQQQSPATPPGFGPQPVIDFNAPPVAEFEPAVDAGDSDEGEGEGEEGPEFTPNGQPGADETLADGQQRRRRRRGRRGRRGRRPEGDQPQQAEGQQQPRHDRQQGHVQHQHPRSPLGSLPTPADALDAPDWPAGGGFDTTPGERPLVNIPPRAAELLEAQPRKPAPQIREEATAPETKPERSSIAAFFGFAPKPQPESEPADAKPARKGWWQRTDDK
jgi:ribonuclease E